MRISDWSSDVCSSDLLDQLAKHLGRGQVVERQHFRGNGTEHRTGAAVLVECIDTKPRQSGNFEREIDFEKFFVIAACLVRHDVVDRSEEHTSELQSLMRISYAVFCLKKKTKSTYML